MPNSAKNLDIKGVLSKFGKNTTWLFLAVLLILFILEAFEIKNSLSILLAANTPPPATAPDRGIRVDFEGYDKVLQRKQDAQTFYPTTTPQISPFGTAK